MTAAVATIRHTEPTTGFGSIKRFVSAFIWLFAASVAAARVADAVRNHRTPVDEDLSVLGLEASMFPRP